METLQIWVLCEKLIHYDNLITFSCKKSVYIRTAYTNEREISSIAQLILSRATDNSLTSFPRSSVTTIASLCDLFACRLQPSTFGTAALPKPRSIYASRFVLQLHTRIRLLHQPSLSIVHYI